MIGVGRLGSLGVVGEAGSIIYDSNAVAFFARLATQPTIARKAFYNGFFVAIRPFISNFDAIWLMAAADAATANTNLISSSFTLTNVATPVFTVDRGYTGGSGLLNTSLSPGTGGLQYQQNNACLGVYTRTTRVADVTFQMGSYDGTTASLLQTFGTGNVFGMDVNDAATAPSVANAANPGFYTAERSNAAGTIGYKNGAQVVANTIASTVPSGTVPIWLLGVNNSGTPLDATTDQEAAATVGSALGPANNAALYSAIQAYMTGVGANV